MQGPMKYTEELHNIEILSEGVGIGALKVIDKLLSLLLVSTFALGALALGVGTAQRAQCGYATLGTHSVDEALVLIISASTISS